MVHELRRGVFACERGERGGDFVEVGADVGGCGAGVVLAGVAGVGAGDGVAELSFYPGEGGVAEPVGRFAATGTVTATLVLAASVGALLI